MNYNEEAIIKHSEWGGKLEIVATPPLDSTDDLAVAYTPGVAAPCLEIQQDLGKSYKYTLRHNLCAVITDGSAVLGLGNIGPEAGMPVMEGKCALFKKFGDVDAFPLCVKTQDVDEFVETVYNISGSFGGINLEDIAAPRCFAIERKLKERCDIPIFHDDQHGTAIVMLSGLINALKLVGKNPETVKVVMSGAGAAGTAICKLLLKYGFGNIIVCDRSGAIYRGREDLNIYKQELADISNPDNLSGSLAEMLVGADIFIGTSAPGLVTRDMIKTMNNDAIVFACANPVPEIFPDEAYAGGARIVATGCSDYPNQVNNLLVFPGVFRGVFDVGATDINEEMKMSAALALASMITEQDLAQGIIIPSALNKNVAPIVAAAVADAAKKSGVIRR